MHGPCSGKEGISGFRPFSRRTFLFVCRTERKQLFPYPLFFLSHLPDAVRFLKKATTVSFCTTRNMRRYVACNLVLYSVEPFRRRNLNRFISFGRVQLAPGGPAYDRTCSGVNASVTRTEWSRFQCRQSARRKGERAPAQTSLVVISLRTITRYYNVAQPSGVNFPVRNRHESALARSNAA